MNIDAIHRLNLWCETSTGTVAPVDLESGAMPPLETHPYAVSRFPLVVQTQHYARRADGGFGAADRIGTFNASANADLVLALATGGKFRLSAAVPFWRRFRFDRPACLSLEHALVVVSEACGRCLNALAYEYGLAWGFPEGGPEWHATNTSCPMCAEGETCSSTVR